MNLTIRKREAVRNRILTFTTGYVLPARVYDIINSEMDKDPDAVLLIHRTRPDDREEYKHQRDEENDGR